MGLSLGSCGPAGGDCRGTRLELLTFISAEVSQQGQKLVKSARYHGLRPTVLGLGEKWSGIFEKVRRYRDYLGTSRGLQKDLVLLADGEDVIVFADAAEIAQKFYKAAGTCQLLVSTERPWRDKSFEVDWQPTGSPYTSINCGLVLGTRAAVLAMLDFIVSLGPKGCSRGDQVPVMAYARHHPDGVALDFQQICLSCVRDDYYASDVEWTGHRLRNTATNTEPAVVHFPGSLRSTHGALEQTSRLAGLPFEPTVRSWDAPIN
eukprot:TRINITY_DN4741_c0_g2_i1.p1 TRINITY_DN4741_c0_g2~~TRINITY_DN4741_c0_g2_i1.p1  ORF type:complete len:274 (+),score=17.57 TRINITY_DN4741_c0_g2_i1:38-823(+)